MDTTDDFETANQKFGPQGGVSEYTLSLSPTGQPTTDKQGLFLRVQTPADGDAKQGGNETLFMEGISTIQFEFWDGQQWLTTWDSVAVQTRRLPAAVRVTYRGANETTDRVIVIRLPLSDVTATNPITQGGA